MARPELGTKRVCPTTGRKFYDLNRDPIVSPYSGEVLPRTGLDLPVSGRVGAGRAAPAEQDDDEEADLAPAAGPETVSLEDVSAAEEEAADVGDDEAAGGEAASDDTFLEEEEEGGDVSDLIDGEIEEDEEG